MGDFEMLKYSGMLLQRKFLPRTLHLFFLHSIHSFLVNEKHLKECWSYRLKMTIPDGNHVYLNDTCCKLWRNVNENIIATSRQHTHTNTCFTMFSSVGRREETKNKHLAFTTLYIQQWLKRYMCSHVKFKNVCGYNRPSSSFTISDPQHICI
jgi:hypothetical protein